MSTREELERLTIPALKALCKERAITGISKAKKDVLVARLLGETITPPDSQATAPPASQPPKKATKKKVRDKGNDATIPAQRDGLADGGLVPVDSARLSGPPTGLVAGNGAGSSTTPALVIPVPPAANPPTPLSGPSAGPSGVTAPPAASKTTAKAPYAQSVPQAPAARERKRAPTPAIPATSQANTKRVKLAPKPVAPVLAAVTSDVPRINVPLQREVSSAKPVPAPVKSGPAPRTVPTKPVATGFRLLARAVKPVAPAPANPAEVTCVPRSSSDVHTPTQILKCFSQSWIARVCRNIQHKTSRGGPTTTPADPLHLLFSRTFLNDPRISTAQLRIALRFVIARLHTSFQVEHHEDILRPLGVTAVELALDCHRGGNPSDGPIELWEVRVQGKRAIAPSDVIGPRRISASSSHAEMREVTVVYLVIGMTGDVVALRREVKARAGGGAASQSTGSRMLQSQTSIAAHVDPAAPFAARWLGAQAGNPEQQWTRGLRDDWARYLSAAPHALPLLKTVRTKEDEQYPSGIARAWVARAQAGMPGELQVAERYVLSNAALNSVSGAYLSTAQMDAERLGQALPDVRPKKPSVAFYLPESHHVESASLAVMCAGKPTPLHPAIAAVTRAASTDLVLRETGQVIGCEEGDGVSELWQALLGCDPRGLPLTPEQAEAVAVRFWQGYKGVE